MMEMIKRIILKNMVLVIFLYSSFVYAQELPRNERDSSGSLINQDYFIANQYPEIQELLILNERYHLNKRVLGDFAAGRFNLALPDIKFVLRYFPNHPKALMLIGTIAKSTKKLSLALPYFKKALQLYPQYALTHAQFGSYLSDIGLIAEGIESLKKATEIDPKLVQAYVWLAKAYYKKGNKELALKATERARELGYKGKVSGEDAGE